MFAVEENVGAMSTALDRSKRYFEHAAADLMHLIRKVSTVSCCDADLHVAFASLRYVHYATMYDIPASSQ